MANHKPVTKQGNRTAKALGEQRRAQIAVLLKAEKSPSEIAKLIGITPQNVHRHIQILQRNEQAERQAS